MSANLLRTRVRPALRRLIRLLPVFGAILAERDELRAELRRLGAGGQALGIGLAGTDPRRLEAHVPIMRPIEERIELATRCHDSDTLPKVPNAGQVTTMDGGPPIQVMHNGIRVLAGGYYGAWMQELITRCSGHHEPQEERVFSAVLDHIGQQATMIELGGFWSFYTIWFMRGASGRRAVVVEPDPAHLEVGRTNAALNGCAPTFVAARAGPVSSDLAPFATESSGIVDLPVVSVPELMNRSRFDHLDLLHCDAQGIEFEILESCRDLFASGRVGWLFVSTHTHHISGDPLTHQRCLSLLLTAGATIVAEHDVQESFSGDGLIVARFGALPDGWRRLSLSRNRCSEGLFRNPLYDLAASKLQ